MLALIDLDGTLVDRDRGFALWARAFVAERDLGDGALTWLEQTDREVKERGEFFANGWVDNQIGKLRRAGMEEVGIRKPDPAMFTLARRRCGASDDPCCWVVGDDPSLDIAGGSASGMGTIWVSHGRPWSAVEHRPDRIGSTPAHPLALLDAT